MLRPHRGGGDGCSMQNDAVKNRRRSLSITLPVSTPHAGQQRRSEVEVKHRKTGRHAARAGRIPLMVDCVKLHRRAIQRLEPACRARALLACGYEVSLALVVSWSVLGFTLHVLFPAVHKTKL